jgi:hypothetical protein
MAFFYRYVSPIELTLVEGRSPKNDPISGRHRSHKAYT